MKLPTNFYLDLQKKVREGEVKSTNDLSNTWKKHLVLKMFSNLEYEEYNSFGALDTDRLDKYLNFKIREYMRDGMQKENCYYQIVDGKEVRIYEQLDLL